MLSDWQWPGAVDDGRLESVRTQLLSRERYREADDFVTADFLRDDLVQSGWLVEDLPAAERPEVRRTWAGAFLSVIVATSKSRATLSARMEVLH